MLRLRRRLLPLRRDRIIVQDESVSRQQVLERGIGGRFAGNFADEVRPHLLARVAPADLKLLLLNLRLQMLVGDATTMPNALVRRR